jgi:hypothetical protein
VLWGVGVCGLLPAPVKVEPGFQLPALHGPPAPASHGQPTRPPSRSDQPSPQYNQSFILWLFGASRTESYVGPPKAHVVLCASSTSHVYFGGPLD